MKKTFISFAMAMLGFSSSFASTSYLPYCFNIGEEVSYNFVSCINRNFDNLGREHGLYLSYCHHFGNTLPYSFVSCVNNNFNQIGRKLHITLPTCFNYGSSIYPFVSCVNSNFSTIDRY